MWATKYQGITTKTIELLSSSYEGLKQNQFHLLSTNGVRKEVWEINLLIQVYKVGNNDVVKPMKKRLELSHESALGIIRNARNLIESWSNMWDHEKIMETALDDVATTRDHISDNPDMNNKVWFTLGRLS